MTDTGAHAEDDYDATPPTAHAFETKAKPRPTTVFTLDGKALSATKPKDAFTVKLGGLATGTPQQQIEANDLLLDRVFDEKSAKHLRKRLDDDDDDFDMDDMGNIVKWLLEGWSDRPTGRSGGSPKGSKRTGRRSTARAR